MASFELLTLDGDQGTRLAKEWDALALSCGASFFLSWDAIHTWITAQRGHANLRALLGRDDRHLVLACVLDTRKFVRYGLFRGIGLTLNSAGEPASDCVFIEHNDVLVHPDADARALLEQMLAFLVEHWPERWHEFNLPGVSQQSRAYKSLIADPPVSFCTHIDKDEASPFIDLESIRREGGDYDAILSANTRRQVRRSTRAYEQEGALTLEVATSVTGALAIFDELAELHQRTWRKRRAAGAFAEERVVRYHRDLIARCTDRDSAHLMRLRCGSRTVGCLYFFAAAGIAWFYQSGLAYEDDNKKKPGLLTHHRAIRHYFDRGYRVYDFLAGDSRYKRSLANQSRRMVWARLSAPARCWRSKPGSSDSSGAGCGGTGASRPEAHDGRPARVEFPALQFTLCYRSSASHARLSLGDRRRRLHRQPRGTPARRCRLSGGGARQSQQGLCRLGAAR